MAVTAPASLDSTALSRRLGELAGHERQLQVEFLLHLDEFDQRKAWAEAGYPSLWEWPRAPRRLAPAADRPTGRLAAHVERPTVERRPAARDTSAAAESARPRLPGRAAPAGACPLPPDPRPRLLQHLLAPRDPRRRLQEGPRPAQVAPRAQGPRRRPRVGPPRGGEVRASAARQAEGRGRAVASAEEPATGEDGRGDGTSAEARAHPGRAPARGVEARRRSVRLAKQGRPLLWFHLEARARPHRPGGARWAEHDREPQGVLPSS